MSREHNGHYSPEDQRRMLSSATRRPLVTRPPRSIMTADEMAFQRLVTEPHRCTQCGHTETTGQKMMTAREVADQILTAPAAAQAHGLILDMVPTGGPVILSPSIIWSDVLGVRWEEGSIHGWRVVLQLGPVHFEKMPATPNTSKETP